MSAKATLSWVALSIGNSRLHWFSFQGPHLNKTWDTAHVSTATLPVNWQEWQQLSPAFEDCPAGTDRPELWIISVVPSQTQFWQTYPQAKVLTAIDLPFQLPYPTFGLDRALCTWTAGLLYGWPILVIDAGTALTYTGAISITQCLGGAILPGLGLQLQSLQATSALPSVSLPNQLPDRWAMDTNTAIQSGIVHTVISSLTTYIHDWLSQFPTSKVVMTGGDAPMLYRYLCKPRPQIYEFSNHIILNPLLQGSGLLHLRQHHLHESHSLETASDQTSG
ncbi:pantothenate kinase [Acaryochloris sp. IP29b_bin.137]|uniref:pantothenate kinase n=1 Tax=Acaryochloris sp. IP29b_bin.137 TaxID=2969217 RepID=UPI002609DB49|nr:pantothenate kinase [Acaryochloris sp. IP29b_bin.137]